MDKYLLNTHAFVLILFIANFSSTYWLRNARLLKLFTVVKITCHFSEAMTRCKDKRPESQGLGLSSPSSASSGALCYSPPAARQAVLEIFGLGKREELHLQDFLSQLGTDPSLLLCSSLNRSSFSPCDPQIWTSTWIVFETCGPRPPLELEYFPCSYSLSLTSASPCFYFETCGAPCCLFCCDIFSSSSAPPPPQAQSARGNLPCSSLRGLGAGRAILCRSQLLLSSSGSHPACLSPTHRDRVVPSPLGLSVSRDSGARRRGPRPPEGARWVAVVAAV